ncbi:hypothetical protein PCC7424_0914 [Gloeothece citriformis PCC 7424]|uniref:Uncharacterized protein n=1 Tax=Gloeothece citriformis (strain PCC 7424) TaxID=65393 RepID=B7KIG4_GLOC7|nr:hypothetical protein [Gloeothece citriformis]ACK69370.1 hypothetical protein PCC7424_0914 [Gloeothece citriformis PCC 7424]
MNTLNSLPSTLNPYPDPWQSEEPTKIPNLMAQSWPIPHDPYPLINPAGKPGAKQLTGHIITPIELLLQDRLKLNLQQVQHWGEAFALLYWLEKKSQEMN